MNAKNAKPKSPTSMTEEIKPYYHFTRTKFKGTISIRIGWYDKDRKYHMKYLGVVTRNDIRWRLQEEKTQIKRRLFHMARVDAERIGVIKRNIKT